MSTPLSPENSKTFMKNRNIRIKGILLLVFVIWAVMIFFLLDSRKNHSQQQHLQLITKRYQLAYNTIYDQYKQLAGHIHSGLMERYGLQDFYHLLLQADNEQKNTLREELLSKFKLRHVYLKNEMKVKHVHFHLRDNESFLRLHRPEKFGDNLEEIRATVEYVNRKHLPVDGFEEGRSSGGYRFVFPITADDKTHLGSMEISFGPEALTSSLMKQYDILSNFFINEAISKRKLFPGELSKVYKKSHHKGYQYDNNVLAALKEVSYKEMKALKPSKTTTDALYANVHSNEAASYYDPSLNVVFTTIPVFNPINNDLNAFLTIRSRSTFFVQEAKYYTIIFSLSLFLVALTLSIFYLQYSRRKILIELNDSLEELVAERTKQLQISKKEWEKTFDAIPDIITLQDRKMKIVRANQTAFDYFQMKPRELLGMTCYDLFRGMAVPCGDCPGILSFADKEKHQSIIKHENLNKFFQVSSAPILDQNNEIQYIVTIAHDVTEKKKLEKELHQAQKMEAVGTLAGGIAHDFNNILAAILGYAEIIQPGIPENSDEKKYLNRMIAAGNRATELVKQILTFSRANSQKRKPLRIDLIVKEAMTMLRSSLPATIDIQTDIEANSGLVLADPTTIHQVVVNLCTNASHAIGKEKGKLEVRLSQIEIGSEQLIGKTDVEAGLFIDLSVKDSGEGMDEETMERIFEPYFTTKKQGEGSGLGLAVTHGIVEKCNGFITVESTPGDGSTFHVFLPCVTENSAETQIPEKNSPLPAGNKERILVVDDEPDLLEIEGSLLTRLGYTVSTETKSPEALETFRAEPESFDLIITDQTMPNLTGDELARAMLKIRPGIPIILCTGYTSTLSTDEAYAIGIKEFLAKPLSERDIAETVRHILDENLPVS